MLEKTHEHRSNIYTKIVKLLTNQKINQRNGEQGNFIQDCSRNSQGGKQ